MRTPPLLSLSEVKAFTSWGVVWRLYCMLVMISSTISQGGLELLQKYKQTHSQMFTHSAVCILCLLSISDTVSISFYGRSKKWSGLSLVTAHWTCDYLNLQLAWHRCFWNTITVWVTWTQKCPLSHCCHCSHMAATAVENISIFSVF